MFNRLNIYFAKKKKNVLKKVKAQKIALKFKFWPKQ